MKNFLLTGQLFLELNEILQVFNPIITNPKSLSNFHPISLFNVVYKIIPELITHRLKPIMSQLLSPTQTCFVLGCKIVDNTVISKALVHSMKLKKGKKEWMAMKVKLDKAYGKLTWSFVHDTLFAASLSILLVDLVMECI